ncbi:MAG: hypothetical protein ACLPH3_24935 [Terracidiphilus sp.]
MIGFISKADIPKMLLSLLVGALLFLATMMLFALLGIDRWPGTVAAVSVLSALLVAGVLGMALGERFWNRMEEQRAEEGKGAVLSPELKRMMENDLRARELSRRERNPQ